MCSKHGRHTEDVAQRRLMQIHEDRRRDRRCEMCRGPVGPLEGNLCSRCSLIALQEGRLQNQPGADPRVLGLQQQILRNLHGPPQGGAMGLPFLPHPNYHIPHPPPPPSYEETEREITPRSRVRALAVQDLKDMLQELEVRSTKAYASGSFALTHVLTGRRSPRKGHTRAAAPGGARRAQNAPDCRRRACLDRAF